MAINTVIVSRQRQWTIWVAACLVAYGVFFTICTLAQPFSDPDRLVIGNLISNVAPGAACCLALLVVRKAASSVLRRTWTLIALAFFSWMLGDASAAISEVIRGEAPLSPHISDLVYAGFYPLMFAGLLAYPTRCWDRRGRLKLLLDVWAVATAVGMSVWYSIFAPLLAAEAQSLTNLAIDLAYPIGDIMLVWALLRIHFGTPPDRRRRPLVMLALGVSFFVCADWLVAALSSAGLYHSGHVIDILWVVGTLIMAGGALAEHWSLATSTDALPAEGTARGPQEKQAGVRSSQLLLPSIALVGAFVLLVLGGLSTAPSIRQSGLLVGTSLFVALILARQILTIQENSQLNHQLVEFSEGLEIRVAERTEELANRLDEITQLNETIELANEELREVDRMKSEFISNVSHELRTPLTSILGYTELMLDAGQARQDPVQVENLQVIHSNGLRLLRLVNDLLDVSRMESGRFTISRSIVRPGPLLRQLADETRLQATNRGISLSVDLPDTLPLLFADGSRLGQVLSNLLSNALKFTPAGGSVIVEGYDVLVSDGTARLPESSVPRWLPVLPDGAWMVVLVTDTGIGIAEEDQHGLFKRFFRTSSAQRDAIQGTGLGLYLAKAIVDAHGGCIGVDSAMGRGSRFWFAVPVIERREG